MTAPSIGMPRFIRKTQLAPGEYRKNFHQIDDEIIATITSLEADQVTPLMSKAYLRLVRAPAKFWEREGVLRFEAEWREAGQLKAWTVLCELLGVASATANKALTWMHDQGIIGYFAGKNGVGIRIFLNRAASSIGTRAASAGKKILDFAPASSGKRRASHNEAAFNDSFAVPENSDSDLNPGAPKNGADKTEVDKISSEPATTSINDSQSIAERKGRELSAVESSESSQISVDEIVRRLRCELEPSLKIAAAQAAQREHERTREWLETRGLPKAARVAQREAYNVLRSQGVISASTQRARADLEVGRSHYTSEAKPLSPEEIQELAEISVAVQEMHGQSIDVTLSEMSSEAGGCLLAEDAPKVRALALSRAQATRAKEE
jgi:hypothetical protein